jgi:hypothetical protein
MLRSIVARISSSSVVVGLSVSALVSLSGCAVTSAAEEQETTDTQDSDLLKKTKETSNWSYRGTMPVLESPKLTVSLAGHTVHVQGLLPAGYTKALPYYAKTERTAAGRTLVHLAYPIATVGQGVTESGLPTRNPEPFTYRVCGGDNTHASNSIGSFGGFPFIEYVCNHRDFDGRVRGGIAFHGPITSIAVDEANYWSLKRGPVSHACNRMMGEHVLELAQVIGFARNSSVTPPVTVIKGFDTLGGKKIDVDYPASGWTRPAASESVVFPIWQAVKLRADGTTELQFPQWACETSRCASMPANKYDPLTGKPLAN